MDWDQFDERVAICMVDGGLNQFDAETVAARDQGKERWEVKNEITRRNTEHARHHRAVYERDAADHMPGVQPKPTKEERPMPERHVQA